MLCLKRFRVFSRDLELGGNLEGQFLLLVWDGVLLTEAEAITTMVCMNI